MLVITSRSEFALFKEDGRHFFLVFSYKEMMPGCYPEKDKDVIMGLTWDPEGELELPGQS